MRGEQRIETHVDALGCECAQRLQQAAHLLVWVRTHPDVHIGALAEHIAQHASHRTSRPALHEHPRPVGIGAFDDPWKVDGIERELGDRIRRRFGGRDIGIAARGSVKPDGIRCIGRQPVQRAIGIDDRMGNRAVHAGHADHRIRVPAERIRHRAHRACVATDHAFARRIDYQEIGPLMVGQRTAYVGRRCLDSHHLPIDCLSLLDLPMAPGRLPRGARAHR